MSAAEQIAADVQRQEASTTADGPTGGSKVPFQSTPALLAALKNFSAGSVIVVSSRDNHLDAHQHTAPRGQIAVHEFL